MAEKGPWYQVQSPEIGGAFRGFYAACNEKGVLDTKTRELLQAALACAFRCSHCTKTHIKQALEVGCTKEEVAEALLITAVEGAGTQLNWIRDDFEDLLGGD